MKQGNGKSVFSGIAIGKVFVFRKHEFRISNKAIEDTEAEMEKYKAAKEKSAAQLKKLYDKTVADVGEEEAMIIDVQLMMLDDLDYEEAIQGRICNDKMEASNAVFEVGQEFAQVFASMDDAYMKARAVDVKDISLRLAMNIQGIPVDGVEMEEPMIVVAEDLAPSETVQFEKDKILAFVTQKGSSNSHTAILARMMNIPSLINADVELSDELNGHMMIVDGRKDTYYIDPDEATLEEMKKLQQEELAKKALLEELKGQETVTQSGQSVHLYANIGSVEDVEAVLANDAEGIGLFRSEFLYLGRDTYPTEEEQFESYKAVAEKMNGKKVIIRTLDIGADKQADYFEIPKEENPALGYRAIRICLDRVELFKTQLRAIYRASAFGTVSIMFPMIISVKEIQDIKKIVEEVKQELDEKKIAYGQIELGIMIETPAAALVSNDLAKEVEFFSVGTNDLTQYTLAIDRQNEKLDNIYDSHHPAVLSLLQMIADNAHANGIWAGICGELAADETLTETFLQMKYDELSVSPAFTLGLRKRIRESK